MDPDPKKNCSDNSIHPYYKPRYTTINSPYKSDGKYSEHYKEVLRKHGRKREPPLESINKCGALYLSEAIAIIQQHCEATYGIDYSESKIQIHIQTCLGETKYPLVKAGKGYFTVDNLEEFRKYSVVDLLNIKNNETTIIVLHGYDGNHFLIKIPKQPHYSDRLTIIEDTIGFSLVKAYDDFKLILKDREHDLPKNQEVVINITDDIFDSVPILFIDKKTKKIVIDDKTEQRLVDQMTPLIFENLKLQFGKKKISKDRSPESAQKALMRNKESITLSHDPTEANMSSPYGAIETRRAQLQKKRLESERASTADSAVVVPETAGVAAAAGLAMVAEAENFTETASKDDTLKDKNESITVPLEAGKKIFARTKRFKKRTKRTKRTQRRNRTQRLKKIQRRNRTQR